MKWLRKREKPAKPLTEAEVLDLFHTLWYPGPMSPDWPFDVSDISAREPYFEKVVQPDLWSNLNLLLDMLSRREEMVGNDKDFKNHIEDYLAAICRLAPDEFCDKVKPFLENPDLRPALFVALCMSDRPQAVEALKPWVDRTNELDTETIEWMVETFGQSLHNCEFDSIICNETLFLLQRLRAEVPAERIAVHKGIDIYFNKEN